MPPTITTALSRLVIAIAAEADKIASIGGEEHIGFGGLAESDDRREAEGQFQDALEHLIDRRIQDKTGAS